MGQLEKQGTDGKQDAGKQEREVVARAETDDFGLVERLLTRDDSGLVVIVFMPNNKFKEHKS